MKTIKDFADKKLFLAYLIANKALLIKQKKSALKFTNPTFAELVETEIIKTLSTENKDDLARGKITRTIIGNTYNWMDSHDDVHLDNVFGKSINERQDKIWHLHDHEQKVISKVGKPISIYEKHIAWKELGVDREGTTMALFMDSSISKDYNRQIFNMYLNKEINQHSVAMRYGQIDLAINDPEIKAEFATWNKVFPLIGNKQKAEQQGFFWAITDADLVEISAVLAGSNELTPTIDNDKSEVEKQICPDCGMNVTPDEDGECPECGGNMKAKVELSFYDKLGQEFAK